MPCVKELLLQYTVMRINEASIRNRKARSRWLQAKKIKQ